MSPLVRAWLLSISLLLCAGSARAQTSADLAPLVNDYLTGYWQAWPASAATQAGVHSQDKKLEDWSAPAMQAEIARNRAVLERLQRIDPNSLNADGRADLDLLTGRVRLLLADLDTQAAAQRRPDRYVVLMGEAVHSLMVRQFAPVGVRYDAVVERLKLYPKFLKQARLNLQNPPEIHTRKALELLPATADYLERGVPSMAAQQGIEKHALSRVQEQSRLAASALRDFGKWMESSLLPASKGNPLLDEKSYRQVFRDRLGTDMTPEQVLAAAESALKSASPAPAAKTLSDADQMASAFRQLFKAPRAVVEKYELAPLPTPDRLEFEPAPPMSPMRQPYLDPAGPFEPNLAFFLYVPAKAALTFDSVMAEVVRHAYPGGYVQVDAMNHTNSRIRKVFPNAAFVAGWEEYAAVLIHEAKFEYPGGNPNAGHDRAVLLDAITDIRLHTGKLTPEQAVDMQIKDWQCDEGEARYRVWRSLATPAEPAAAFTGKLELLRLRTDIREAMGAAFIAKEYHIRLLSLGAPSFRTIRDLLK